MPETSGRPYTGVVVVLRVVRDTQVVVGNTAPANHQNLMFNPRKAVAKARLVQSLSGFQVSFLF